MYGDTLPYCFSFFTDPHSLAAVESYYTHTHSFSLDPPPTATFVSFSMSLSWPFLHSLACPLFPIQMLIFLPNFLEAKKHTHKRRWITNDPWTKLPIMPIFKWVVKFPSFFGSTCLVDSVSQFLNSTCKTLQFVKRRKKMGKHVTLLQPQFPLYIH